MIITSAAAHGMRIIQILIRSEKPVKTREIAKHLHLSEPYTEQVTSKLRKRGIVVTHRGCNGGYALHHQWQQKSIWDILEATQTKPWQATNTAIDWVIDEMMVNAMSVPLVRCFIETQGSEVSENE